MKRKIIATTAIVALACTMLGSHPVMAEEKTTGMNYEDKNQDGICDNYKENCDGTQRRLRNCDGTQQGRQVRNRCGANKN